MNAEDYFTDISIDYFRTASDPDITVVVPTIPASSHKKVKELIKNQNFNKQFEAFAVNDANFDLCEARNIGLQIAKADIVAFTDDDCYPSTNWILKIYNEFKEDVICVEGSVSGGINYNGSRRYVGCNLATKRDAALDIGGFRSEYDGWRDDTEFGWRMERAADGECIFSQGAHVNHPTRPRASFVKKNERQLKNEYPNRYDEILNNSLVDIGYRKLHKYGLVNKINNIRHEDK